MSQKARDVSDLDNPDGIFAFLFGKSQRITGVEFEAISKTWLEQVANFVQMWQFTEIHFFIRSSKNVFKNQVQKVSLLVEAKKKKCL